LWWLPAGISANCFFIVACALRASGQADAGAAERRGGGGCKGMKKKERSLDFAPFEAQGKRDDRRIHSDL